MITRAYKRLQAVTGVYKGLKRVSRGYRVLQGITGVKKGYRGLKRVT